LQDGVFAAPGRWSLKKCSNAQCGLLWLDPMPVPEDLSLAYEGYYTHGEPERSLLSLLVKYVYQFTVSCTLFVAGIPQEKRRSALMYLGNRSPGTLLDVGCGDGTFLATMAKRGWKVTGIDFDPLAVEAARTRYGLDVHVGTVGTLVEQRRQFDVVTASHVLEHVPDPIEFLSQCRHLLRPGGCLVLKTPNAESFGHRRYAGAWRGLEPPRHLHIFSLWALEHSARRAGFSRCDAFTSFAGSGGMMVVSRFLARKGSFRMHELSGLDFFWARILEPLYALESRFVWLLDRRSGEEICAVLAHEPDPAK
jgi:SAM-dependent methyltransferase